MDDLDVQLAFGDANANLSHDVAAYDEQQHGRASHGSELSSPAKRSKGRPKLSEEQKEANRLAKLAEAHAAVSLAPAPLQFPAHDAVNGLPVAGSSLQLDLPEPVMGLDPLLAGAPAPEGPPKKKRGRPLGSKNKPGHQAGRPRKGTLKPSLTAPPKEKRPVGRPRKIPRPDGEPIPPKKPKIPPQQPPQQMMHPDDPSQSIPGNVISQAILAAGQAEYLNQQSAPSNGLPLNDTGDILVGLPGPSLGTGDPSSVIDPQLEMHDHVSQQGLGSKGKFPASAMVSKLD